MVDDCEKRNDKEFEDAEAFVCLEREEAIEAERVRYLDNGDINIGGPRASKIGRPDESGNKEALYV